MLSFKKWLEATGQARVHTAADLELPSKRIAKTKGGVHTYDGIGKEPVSKSECDPEDLFGIKKIERQSKK